MVRGLRTIKIGKIWVPQDIFTPFWKAEIIDNSGTTHTIADTTSSSAIDNNTVSATITRTATENIGRWNIILDNTDGKYVNVFAGGNTIKFFADYTDATNEIFRGKIDNVLFSFGSSGRTCSISGRDYPEIVDKNIIKNFTNSNASDAIKSILTTYHPSIGQSEIDTSTKTITKYYSTSGWDAIRNICEIANLDAYIYYNTSNSEWRLKVFEKGSINNDNERAVVGDSLISVDSVGNDNTQVYNEVSTYGKQDGENVFLLSTKSNDVSQNKLWIKSKTVTDSTLITLDDVSTRAENEIDIFSVAPFIGNINAIGMISLNPGERIWCTEPYSGISGYQNIREFTHSFNNNGFITTMQLNKKPRNLSTLFLDRIRETEELRTQRNQYANTNSYTIFFDESPSLIKSHSGTEEKEGQLIISTGNSNGNVTSEIHTADENITNCVLYINGNETGLCSYQISNDNGTSYSTISPGIIHTFTSTGKKLILKMGLVSDANNQPTFDSIAVLYT